MTGVNQTYIETFLAELERVTREVNRSDINRAVDVLFNTWQRRGTVFLMGNGGSASTATHFACDLAKVTIVPDKPRLRVMSLVDNIPLVSAWTNDSGFDSIYVEQLEPWLAAGDTLIGLSVHGGSKRNDGNPWSQNLGRAMALASERGAHTLGLSGFDGGALKEMSEVCVVVPMALEPLGTPIVEAFHVVLHHLLATALKRRIEAA
jgi:D-sedoheptulose 7-phosphate isomerase